MTGYTEDEKLRLQQLRALRRQWLRDQELSEREPVLPPQRLGPVAAFWERFLKPGGLWRQQVYKACQTGGFVLVRVLIPAWIILYYLKYHGTKKPLGIVMSNPRIFPRLEEIHNASSYDIAELKRARYKEDILQLSEALMGLEILITDQLEEILEEFKRNIAAVASTFIENVKGMMNQCRDLENNHHEKLLEISITTLEKSVKNELNVDLPAAVQELLVDKTTIVNAVNASHGTRLQSIDKRESDILNNIYHWQNSVTEKAFQKEIDRNRNRVKEIILFIENLQEELDSIEIPEPME